MHVVVAVTGFEKAEEACTACIEHTRIEVCFFIVSAVYFDVHCASSLAVVFQQQPGEHDDAATLLVFMLADV